MKWLCKIGLHRFVRVYSWRPDDEGAWIFGPLMANGELCCLRCRKRVREDTSPPPGDYD